VSQFIPDIRQGDTYRLRVEYPYGTDIRGYKFWLTLKRQFKDSDAHAVLQVSQVASGEEAQIGHHYLEVSSAETTAVLPGSYFWDVQVMTASGDVKTLLPPEEYFDDQVRVIPQVTQANS
jgi:hypothetical protein